MQAVLEFRRQRVGLGYDPVACVCLTYRLCFKLRIELIT